MRSTGRSQIGCPEMRNLSRRVQKLEGQLKDPRGLIPCSEEWFDYWSSKIDRVIEGDLSIDLAGISLEFVDLLIAKGAEGASG